jgi:hypothetical protein
MKSVFCILFDSDEMRKYFYCVDMLTVGFFEFMPDDFRAMEVSGNYARKSVTELYNLVFRLTSVKLYAYHVSPFSAFSRNIVRDLCVTTVHMSLVTLVGSTVFLRHAWHTCARHKTPDLFL